MIQPLRQEKGKVFTLKLLPENSMTRKKLNSPIGFYGIDTLSRIGSWNKYKVMRQFDCTKLFQKKFGLMAKGKRMETILIQE